MVYTFTSEWISKNPPSVHTMAAPTAYPFACESIDHRPRPEGNHTLYDETESRDPIASGQFILQSLEETRVLIANADEPDTFRHDDILSRCYRVWTEGGFFDIHSLVKV
jgi:hypothetical protein